MSWIIRNAQGEICGHCRNKPGAGNLLPDGSSEIVEYFEDDPKVPGYSTQAAGEVNAFLAAQEARLDVFGKRDAALASLAQERLTEAAAKPDAPQAVKDYAAAVARK